MARQTTRGANIAVPQTREQASAAVAEVGRLEREIGLIQAGVDEEIARITERAEAAALPLKDKLSATIEGVRIWAEANRSSITDDHKTKTVLMGTGTISWRLRPAKVSIRGGDTICEVLRRLGFERFIRVKEEADKDAMRREPEIARQIPGVSIGSEGEDFAVEALKTPIAEGV